VQPYADVGIWPKKGLRGVVHFRLSHRLGGGAVVLSLAGQHLHLAAGASDAWAADPRMDAAIVAAMRSAESMTVSGRDRAGACLPTPYPLSGAATAMDAAALACAGH
jgi:hypothetical protein